MTNPIYNSKNRLTFIFFETYKNEIIFENFSKCHISNITLTFQMNFESFVYSHLILWFCPFFHRNFLINFAHFSFLLLFLFLFEWFLLNFFNLSVAFVFLMFEFFAFLCKFIDLNVPFSPGSCGRLNGYGSLMSVPLFLFLLVQ